MGGHTKTGTVEKTGVGRSSIAPMARRARELPGEKRQYPLELQNITLNDKERKIFSLLQSAAQKAGTTVRVAGGWVRDKLMGLENNDIDVSVEGMTGEDFAKHVAAEMGTDPAKIAVIRENPEQSKHLATATMKIEGLPIDMVNLRSETYSDPNSRVPEQKMGTAEEDAARRDLTINSLFYNINTGEVEDFTGKGLQDLRDGVARAPLPGKQTFLDDPLRVLRLVRFASRFGHKVDPETMQAMSDPEVQEAFTKKVAPDRIHKELDGALMADPEKAVRLWFETGIIDKIIPEARAMDMDQKSKYHDKTVLEHTIALLKHIHEKDPKNVALKWAALLHDIGKPPTAKPDEAGNLHFVGHEAESAKMSETILRRLKYPTVLINRVSKLVQNHMFPFENKWAPLKFNRNLRDMAQNRQELDDLLKLREADIHGGGANMFETNMEEHKQLLDKLQNMDVDAVLNMKPYATGDELQKMFNMKPGKWIGVVNEQLLNMQLAGQIKDKEDALKYLQGIVVDNTGKITKKEMPVNNVAIQKLFNAKPGPWMGAAMAMVSDLVASGKATTKEEILAHLQRFTVENGKLVEKLAPEPAAPKSEKPEHDPFKKLEDIP